MTKEEHARLSTLLGAWEMASIVYGDEARRVTKSHVREGREFLREYADTDPPPSPVPTEIPPPEVSP